MINQLNQMNVDEEEAMTAEDVASEEDEDAENSARSGFLCVSMIHAQMLLPKRC